MHVADGFDDVLEEPLDIADGHVLLQLAVLEEVELGLLGDDKDGVGRLHHLVHLDDVGVVELGPQLRLVVKVLQDPERLGVEGVERRLLEDLDGNGAAVRHERVWIDKRRRMHRRERSVSKRALECVMVHDVASVVVFKNLSK